MKIITLFFVAGTTFAQTLLSDSFSGSSLNASNWTARTPFSDSSVTVSGGVVSLANGAGFISNATYTTPIRIDFSFAFTGGNYDSFRVYDRADQFNGNGYGLTHGVGVSFRVQEDTGNLSGNIALEAYGVTLSTGTMSLTANTYYTFSLVDDGTNLSFYVNGSATPFLTGSSTDHFGNKVGTFNREGAGNGSSISAGSVSSLDYLTVTAVPEPAAWGAVAGLCAVGVALRARKKCRNS